MSITIDKEFESLIPPLTDEEFQQLEENCVKEGIRDALITWNGILIDGHNRFKISAKHGLHWTEKKMEFADRDEAKLWIVRNQKGRRNLDSLAKISLRLAEEKLIAKEAKKRTGGRPKKADKDSCPVLPQTRKEKRENSTDYKVAKSIGMSEDTYRKGKTILESGNRTLIQQVKDGTKSINGAYNDIKEQERRRVDLSAKAHLEKAEERHKDFQESKTVNITDVAQDRKDTAEIAQSKYNEIYNAIKKILFIGASNFDYSIINTKTMDANDIRRLQGELGIAADILKKIREEIGG